MPAVHSLLRKWDGVHLDHSLDLYEDKTPLKMQSFSGCYMSSQSSCKSWKSHENACSSLFYCCLKFGCYNEKCSIKALKCFCRARAQSRCDCPYLCIFVSGTCPMNAMKNVSTHIVTRCECKWKLKILMFLFN